MSQPSQDTWNELIVTDIDNEKSMYLTFRLALETYAFGILRVKEIINMTQITRVPGMPKYVRGIINLRGKVIPILCLRAKFGLEATPQTDRTCIVIAEYEEMMVGFIVDEVSDVYVIPEESIEDYPALDIELNSDFFAGVGRAQDRIIMILNIDAILTDDDLLNSK